MPSWIRIPKTLAGLGELAHSARIYAGRNVNDGRGRVVGHVPQSSIRAAIDWLISSGHTAGFTAYAAEGRYGSVDKGGKTTYFPREKTAVLELVTSGRDKCPAVIQRARHVGALLAKRLRQETVLVTVACANGKRDAAFVGQDGQPAFPVPRLPSPRTPHRR